MCVCAACESTKSYFGPPLPYTNLIRLVDEIRLVDILQKGVSWSDERIADDISHTALFNRPNGPRLLQKAYESA